MTLRLAILNRTWCWLPVWLVFCVAAMPPTIEGASFPAARGAGGAVAASETAATNAGLEILRRGGNAVDAAVATALALAVVHPEAGNLGGGGFALVKMGDELASLDFRETAPAAARSNLYQDENGRLIPEASVVGPLAAGIPGTPLGLWVLHERFGRLPWPLLVAPAQRLAADGFRLSSRTHETLVRHAGNLARFPETAAVWLPGGHPPEPGDLIRLPALSQTLADYAESGPRALTSGAAAEAIEKLSAKYGGILSAADLESYEPVWRAPLRFEGFGWSFASMDLPASGGIIIAQAIRQLEAVAWQDQPRFGLTRVHLLAEILRRSFADRYLLGDPSTTEADAEDLLAADWLEWRRSSIDRQRATPSVQVASLPDQMPLETTDTTHLSIVDADGNLVSMTTTLNGAFGCKLLIPEVGYFLNNQMDDFSTAPGAPNMYGLVQGGANAVAAGKRMLSSMSPTIAWRQREMLAVGGRGGSKIPTATLQVLLNIVVDEDPLQTAVDRPRIHHQWLPDLLRSEADALSPETRLALEGRGHVTEVWPESAKINAVRLRADGSVEAAADPRGPAAAGVVEPIP